MDKGVLCARVPTYHSWLVTLHESQAGSANVGELDDLREFDEIAERVGKEG